MTRGPSPWPNYTALDSTTPHFQPPSLQAVVPSEKRVCLQGRPGEERQGPGQKAALGPALFCMVAAVFFYAFFLILPFLFFWPSGLCEDVMEARGADMMDESGVHGRKTGGGGGCRDDRDGGAQCRAACLRGTCKAWGGPGWWGDPVGEERARDDWVQIFFYICGSF